MDGLQSSECLQSSTRTPEEKLARRRARRWKRRARIAGPFIGVSILFAALSLSVGLIEYEPMTDPNRLSDQPIHLEAAPQVERVGQRVSLTADSFTSVNSVIPDDPSEIGHELIDDDLRLPPKGDVDLPMPPEMIRYSGRPAG